MKHNNVAMKENPNGNTVKSPSFPIYLQNKDDNTAVYCRFSAQISDFMFGPVIILIKVYVQINP